MVITVMKYRDWNRPTAPRIGRHPRLPSHLREWEGGYRSATVLGTCGDGASVEIDVFLGRRGGFTPAMRMRAQEMVDRLVLPNWPP
jgi:hypothetical protein